MMRNITLLQTSFASILKVITLNNILFRIMIMVEEKKLPKQMKKMRTPIYIIRGYDSILK